MFDKLTVLMPTYNHALYLPQALDSVLSQTFTDFELIALNDGSTDNTIDILKTYAKKDSRITVCDHKFNMGRGLCRNALVGMAQTPVCSWFDSDDIMYPTKLEKQLNYMNSHPECKFLGTEMESLLPDGKIEPGCCTAEDYEHIGEPGKSLEEWNCIGNPTIVFLKNIVLDLCGYRDDYKEVEDLEFWKRVYESGERVYCLPERLYLYRLGSHSK